MWSYISKRNTPKLIFSGIFAGLAMLSKTPTLFLLPYFLLVIFMGLLTETLNESKLSRVISRQNFFSSVRGVLIAFLIWMVALAVTYFILWPSMWSQPIETLRQSIIGTDNYRTAPHPFPIYFMGESILTDPGVLFYPLNMIFKSTAVATIGLILSIVMLFFGKLQRREKNMIIFALVFIFFSPS